MDYELNLAMKYQRALAQKRAAYKTYRVACNEMVQADEKFDRMRLKIFAPNIKRRIKIAEHFAVINAVWAITNGLEIDYGWTAEEDIECDACGDSNGHGYSSPLYIDDHGNERTYCWQCRDRLDAYDSLASFVEDMERDEDDTPENVDWVPLGPKVGKVVCSTCEKAPPTQWLLFSDKFRCESCKK